MVYLVAVIDLLLLIDNKLLSKRLAKLLDGELKRGQIHIGAIILVTLCVSFLMLLIGCVISLIPGPIYDALLAYDNGSSTDLTLPIIFWIFCVLIDIILTVLISVQVNKKLNKKISKSKSTTISLVVFLFKKIVFLLKG